MLVTKLDDFDLDKVLCFGKFRKLALSLEVSKGCPRDAPTIKQLHWMERQHFRSGINPDDYRLSPALSHAKSTHVNIIDKL